MKYDATLNARVSKELLRDLRKQSRLEKRDLSSIVREALEAGRESNKELNQMFKILSKAKELVAG